MGGFEEGRVTRCIICIDKKRKRDRVQLANLHMRPIARRQQPALTDVQGSGRGVREVLEELRR